MTDQLATPLELRLPQILPGHSSHIDLNSGPRVVPIACPIGLGENPMFSGEPYGRLSNASVKLDMKSPQVSNLNRHRHKLYWRGVGEKLRGISDEFAVANKVS